MLEKVTVSEGNAGRWSISKFTVSEEDERMSRVHAMIRGRGYVPRGTYTQLRRGGTIVMSDTPDEMQDHYEPVRRARDHVLINGLGLGMVLASVLKKSEVSKVTVVEIDQSVIDLVGPHYNDERVEIVHASAFDYKPPKDVRYGAVWHDIWDYICGDNLAEMTRLKRKYGRRADWQGCWAEYQCRRGR